MSHYSAKSPFCAAFCLFTALATSVILADEQASTPVGRITFSGGHGQDSAVFTVQDDGNAEKRLTDGGMDLLPQWSPDGKHIAFLALRKQDYELAETNDFAFHWFLYVMDADGSNQRRVSTTPVGMFFEWSPDGKRFLFQSSHEDPRNRGKDGIVSSAIYVMNVDGTGKKRLTPIEGIDSLPSWSPDGKRIAIGSDRNGTNELYLVVPEGGDAVPLTTGKNVAGPPAWSPDGKLIATSTGREKDDGVWLVSTDGKHQNRISDSGKPMSWPPEGNALLVLRGGGIVILDTQGRTLRRLTPPTIRALDAVFSPDGSRVFYRTRSKDGFAIFSVKNDGSNRIQLTQPFDRIIGLSVSSTQRQ